MISSHLCTYEAVAVFVFGLIIGSFLNVVVYRLNSGKTLGGRSVCLSCGHCLRWYELIPVFSYLLQGGKCKSCGSRISIQYPLVEILSGLVFLSMYLLHAKLLVGVTLFIATAFYSAIFSLLLVIAVYDSRHKIIPNLIVYPFIVLSFISHLLDFRYDTISMRSFDVMSWDLWMGPLLFAFFALLWLVSGGRWMGFGDAKLVLGIGFLLGAANGINSMVLAFWIAAAVGILLLLASRRSLTMKSEIPFAPYLIVATYIQFIFGWQFLLL